MAFFVGNVKIYTIFWPLSRDDTSYLIESVLPRSFLSNPSGDFSKVNELS
jgi:hypothetical protein